MSDIARQLAEGAITATSTAAGVGVGLLAEAIPVIGPFVAPLAGWLTEKFVDWAGHKIIDSGHTATNYGVRGTPNDLVVNHRNAANMMPVHKKENILSIHLHKKKKNKSIPLTPITPLPPANIIVNPTSIASPFTHGIYQQNPIIKVQYGRDNSYTSYAHQGPNSAFGTSGFVQNEGEPVDSFPVEKKTKRKQKKIKKYKYVI